MSLILTVISLGTRVALAYALAGPVGVRGIWISIPIGWLLADGAGLLYYRRHRNTLTFEKPFTLPPLAAFRAGPALS